MTFSASIFASICSSIFHAKWLQHHPNSYFRDDHFGILFATFSENRFSDAFLSCFGSLLGSFGFPFGILWLAFWSLWLPLHSILVSPPGAFSTKILNFQQSRLNNKICRCPIPHNTCRVTNFPLCTQTSPTRPGAEPCRRQPRLIYP